MTWALLAQVDSVAGAADDAARSNVAGGIVASPLLWVCVLFALGMWLSLPRGGAGGRRIGIVLVVISLGLCAARLPLLAGWLNQSLFSLLAVVTVASCVAAVISRNPVYAAIWFGLALLGTAGLFLLAGAQFLSVATVTVYAGAILVTFLFVIMLAQPRGDASYDRVSWEAFLSASAGAILVGLLTTAIGRSLEPAASGEGSPVAASAVRDNAAAHGVLAEHHVAHLGQELLGRHLIAMQAAGALMFAALVGAVAIVAHGRKIPSAADLTRGSRLGQGEEGLLELPAGPVVSTERKALESIHA